MGLKILGCGIEKTVYVKPYKKINNKTKPLKYRFWGYNPLFFYKELPYFCKLMVNLGNIKKSFFDSNLLLIKNLKALLFRFKPIIIFCNTF
jgi:hypothetical protein